MGGLKNLRHRFVCLVGAIVAFSYGLSKSAAEYTALYMAPSEYPSEIPHPDPTLTEKVIFTLLTPLYLVAIGAVTAVAIGIGVFFVFRARKARLLRDSSK